MENNYILQLENVSLTMGDLHLDNVSFAIPKGYLMGLVGANGSGKSSLIKTILNVYQKDTGTIQVAGYDNQEQEILAKQQIGLVLEEVPYFASLSLEQIAEFHGMLYPDFSLDRYRRLLSEYEVVKKEQLDYHQKMWREFSKGQQIRAQLAFALAHNPKLLILDEPTANLSPLFRRRLRNDLQCYMEQGGSVLLCTHIISDLDKIGDYITILDNGQILASENKEQLLEQYKAYTLEDVMLQMIHSCQTETKLETQKKMVREQQWQKNKKTLRQQFVVCQKKDRQKGADYQPVTNLENTIWHSKLENKLWIFVCIIIGFGGIPIGYMKNAVYQTLASWLETTFVQSIVLWYLCKWYIAAHNRWGEYSIHKMLSYLPLTRKQQQAAYWKRVKQQAIAYGIYQILLCFVVSICCTWTLDILWKMCISVIVMCIIPYVAGWYSWEYKLHDDI